MPKTPSMLSSVLFDTVAIYLAISHDLVTLEELPIAVTDDGHTRIDPQGKRVTCAMSWKDLAKFEDFLVDRLHTRSLTTGPSWGIFGHLPRRLLANLGRLGDHLRSADFR